MLYCAQILVDPCRWRITPNLCVCLCLGPAGGEGSDGGGPPAGAEGDLCPQPAAEGADQAAGEGDVWATGPQPAPGETPPPQRVSGSISDTSPWTVGPVC